MPSLNARAPPAESRRIQHFNVTPLFPGNTHTSLSQVREKCLKALKDRLIERANIIQVRCGACAALSCPSLGLALALMLAMQNTTRHTSTHHVTYPILHTLCHTSHISHTIQYTSAPRITRTSHVSRSQARLDEETAALAKRQQNFQRDRDQMSSEEEEEFEKAMEESMFRWGCNLGCANCADLCCCNELLGSHVCTVFQGVWAAVLAAQPPGPCYNAAPHPPAFDVHAIPAHKAIIQPCPLHRILPRRTQTAPPLQRKCISVPCAAVARIL